jgi:hypothetical protein
LTPEGFLPAEVFVTGAPDNMAKIKGNALLVRAKPGEGAFILSKATFAIQKSAVILNVDVLSGPGKPAFALIGLNSPLDGQLAYHLVQDEAITPGMESRLNLIYQPPQPRLQAALQVANLPGSTEDVFVLFDNLRVMQLDITNDIDSGQFASQKIDVNPDGAFDVNLNQLLMNVNGVTGSVQKYPISGVNKALQLSVDADENAANAGVVFQNTPDLFPGVFFLEAFAGRYVGVGGNVALAMGNGKHTMVVFEDASSLPYRLISKRLILGGNFESANAAMNPIAIVQHAGAGEFTSILIDNLTVRKISSDFQ